MPVERKKAEKVGLRFSETMSGYLAEGVVDFEEGEKKGQEQDNPLSFDVAIEIEKRVLDQVRELAAGVRAARMRAGG